MDRHWNLLGPPIVGHNRVQTGSSHATMVTREIADTYFLGYPTKRRLVMVHDGSLDARSRCLGYYGGD